MKSQMINALLIIIKTVVKLSISTLFAYAVYLLFAPLALMERGYFAIGGEALLAIMMFAGTYYVLDKIENMRG